MRRTACIAALSILAAACATTPRPATKLAADFVANATAVIGAPYRYGGAAPDGFDCSGLVVYAAAGTGLQLPRTTQELFQIGTPVGRDSLAAGDLVFMRLQAKEMHVGIAVDERRFVHAPSTGGHVRIDSIDAAPYAQGFLGARRLPFQQ